MSRTKPSRKEAEDAVRVLIRWAGDNPEREGLMNTPNRVVSTYETYFSGYTEQAQDHLHCIFSEASDCAEIIVLRDIRYESHCERHMSPVIGYAHIAYLPNKGIVGIGQLARVVDLYAKRLQIQEQMTAQIAQAIMSSLDPHGVAVLLEASHHCLTCRGAHKTESRFVTYSLRGVFKDNGPLRQEVLGLLKSRRGETL